MIAFSLCSNARKCSRSMEYENLSDLNELAAATDGLSKADMEKLGAVVMLAKPKSAAQIKNLAESLDLFDFAPDAHFPAEYGKYMIRQSGRFDYDENLDAFYDYEKYGTERMNTEDGMFTDRGYIAYKGGLYQHGGSDEQWSEQPHGDGRDDVSESGSIQMERAAC